MFNLGLPELMVIGMAALLVFGPKRLPELAKGLGKGIRDFKKALEGQEEEKGQETAARSQEPATLTGAEPRVKATSAPPAPAPSSLAQDPVAQS